MRRLLLILTLISSAFPAQAAAAAPVAECGGAVVTIVGTAHADFLQGTPGPDVIDGRGGDDWIWGRGGDDIICGGPGADVISGGGGADRLLGQGGRDLLRGERGADALRGAGGSDLLLGGGAGDDLDGGGGGDTLIGGGGSDDASGGPGRDWCRTSETTMSCATAAPTSARAIDARAARADATFEHIGVRWNVRSDIDLDSRMVLEFRRTGTRRWRPGAPAMRAYPSIFVHDGPLGLDYWAASAMWLDEATEYDLRLTVMDPDGGSRTKLLTATTRSVPQPANNSRDRYVVPGDGGGSGTAADPFRGLQAAADAAMPGDVLHVAAGTYTPFQILASGTKAKPIVFLGPAAGVARVDGGGTDRGIVTLGEFNQTLGHVIVDGLTLEDGHWGIDAQHTHDIVIRNNVIRQVDDGVVNRRGDALESNQTVCDNVIHGRTPWPGVGIPGERGIDLRGTGNVVCHNEVRNFGDCVSVQPITGASYGSDVYGNDAAFCVDDGIEVDYHESNVRVWRNRVTNARMGVSLQPIAGGPAYVLRNSFFNLESKPIKMHNFTTGFFVVHNSGAKHGNGHSDGAMWRNAVFRNNVFVGTRYAFEFTTVADEGFRDLDYNAWGTSRTIDPGGPWFKWDNVRYDRIGDLPPGVERHGVETGFGDLRNANLPADWDVAADPNGHDLRLRSGVAAVNAGIHLPNLNDPFPLRGRPDMGAFERGEPLPRYGPRN